MDGLANTYKESGWLPEWASPGHRNVMIGSNSSPIISDAFLKGVKIEQSDILLEAMLKKRNHIQKRPKSNGRVINSVGREGVEYYNQLGYVPYDVGINENAARTPNMLMLILQLLKMAQKWVSAWRINFIKDPLTTKTCLIHKQSGCVERIWMEYFSPHFNPLKWGDAFTEGNSLHTLGLFFTMLKV